MVSGVCGTSGDHLDGCHEEPGCCAFDGSFEVLGQSAVVAEPSEGAFDDQSAWDDLEALGGIGSLDDPNCPTTDFGQRTLQLVAGITAIGEEVA